MSTVARSQGAIRDLPIVGKREAREDAVVVENGSCPTLDVVGNLLELTGLRIEQAHVIVADRELAAECVLSEETPLVIERRERVPPQIDGIPLRHAALRRRLRRRKHMERALEGVEAVTGGKQRSKLRRQRESGCCCSFGDASTSRSGGGLEALTAGDVSNGAVQRRLLEERRAKRTGGRPKTTGIMPVGRVRVRRVRGVDPGSRTRVYGRSRNRAAYSVGVWSPRPAWWRWRL